MSREALGLWLGVIGVVAFGGTLPFTRLAVQELSPWFVTAGRAAIAGMLAMALLLLLRRRIPSPAALGRLGLVSLCLVAGFPAFTGLAMTRVDASHGGVVLGVLPLATAAASVVLSGERPSPRFWMTALAGAAIVIAFAMREGAGEISMGDLLLVGAVVSAAVGYAVSGKLAREMPGWEVISWALVIAMPATVPLALLLRPDNLALVDTKSWIGFAYVTLMSQYLAFFAWNAGLALGGVARVSQVQLLQIFVTLGMAAMLNNERIDAITWISALLVVLVVLVGRRAQVQEAR